MAAAHPDRAALDFAHRQLSTPLTLDYMLQHQTHVLVLNLLARRHMQRRERLDAKKLQANDIDLDE